MSNGEIQQGISFKRLGDQLHECLRTLYNIFQGSPTLYIIDDCSAKKELTKKKDMLSELAFSGCHAIKVCGFVLKNITVFERPSWTNKMAGSIHCKDRDSFEDSLRENDVIPTKEERDRVRCRLAQEKHTKLILKTDQPTAYTVV